MGFTPHFSDAPEDKEMVENIEMSGGASQVWATSYFVGAPRRQGLCSRDNVEPLQKFLKRLNTPTFGGTGLPARSSTEAPSQWR